MAPYDEELKALLTAEGVETLKEFEEKRKKYEQTVELKNQFFDGGEGSGLQKCLERIVVGEREGGVLGGYRRKTVTLTLCRLPSMNVSHIMSVTF